MSIYKEEILEHYKDPQNFGELDGADVVVEEHNPLCGDNQKWSIKFKIQNSKFKTVEDIRFTGDGCAISMATASMLSEKVKGMTIDNIQGMSRKDMVKLIGTDVSPARVKCLMLSLNAIKKGLV